MSLRIPTSTTFPFYSQTTTLDGQDYVFRFLWNQREGTWFFSLLDADEDPIVEGLKVVVNLPLLRLVTDERKPPGVLLAVDTTAPEVDRTAGEKVLALDPGLEELGERVLLLYFSEAEIESLGLGA